MIDSDCIRFMRTPCLKDSKGKHFWERRGIVNFVETGAMCQIWQCTQCDLCAEETLEFIQPDALVALSETKQNGGKQ